MSRQTVGFIRIHDIQPAAAVSLQPAVSPGSPAPSFLIHLQLFAKSSLEIVLQRFSVAFCQEMHKRERNRLRMFWLCETTHIFVSNDSYNKPTETRNI
jgi:hypothetical protein